MHRISQLGYFALFLALIQGQPVFGQGWDRQVEEYFTNDKLAALIEATFPPDAMNSGVTVSLRIGWKDYWHSEIAFPYLKTALSQAVQDAATLGGTATVRTTNMTQSSGLAGQYYVGDEDWSMSKGVLVTATQGLPRQCVPANNPYCPASLRFKNIAIDHYLEQWGLGKRAHPWEMDYGSQVGLVVTLAFVGAGAVALATAAIVHAVRKSNCRRPHQIRHDEVEAEILLDN